MLALLSVAALAVGVGFSAGDTTTYPDSVSWSEAVATYEWEIASPCEDVSYLSREETK